MDFRRHHDERMLRPLPLLLDSALRCVYACPRRDEEGLELMTRMYKALPSREEVDDELDRTAVTLPQESAAESAPAKALSMDALDVLYTHLKVQHSLQEYGCLQPMSRYREALGGWGLSTARGEYLLHSLARYTARRTPLAGLNHWMQTRDDMVELRELACMQLPQQLPCCHWLFALLLAEQAR